MDDLVKKSDYVINFAAESHVDRSITDPEIFIKSNVLGTQVLLNAAKEYGVEKYIQISTDEVYGTLGKEGYFTETTPLQPNSPYSASKAVTYSSIYIVEIFNFLFFYEISHNNMIIR